MTFQYVAVVRRLDDRVAMRDRTLRHPELIVFHPSETLTPRHGVEVVLISSEVDLFPQGSPAGPSGPPRASAAETGG